MEGTEPRQQQPPTPGAFLSPPVAPEGYTFTTIPPSSFPTTFDDEDEHKEYHSLGRAGLDTKPRLIFMTGLGSFWGFCMGSFLGGRQSGLQYLAENAHRLPTTVQGWYFYHKTKNYRVMLGGIKRGMQYAGRTGGLCLLYGTIEAGYDRIRGEADILNSLSAGVTTGLLFSAMSKWFGQTSKSPTDFFFFF